MLQLHRLLKSCRGAGPTRFGTQFFTLERLVECQDALEETMACSEFKNWVRDGNTVPSCPCCASSSSSLSSKLSFANPHTEVYQKGKKCREDMKLPDHFERAEQLVKTIE